MTREQAEYAGDRNVCVYDSDAEPGVFSRRLIVIMKTCIRRGPADSQPVDCQLESVHVPAGSMAQADGVVPVDIPVEPLPEWFEEWSEGYPLPPGKKILFVAVGSDGVPLFGAF